MNFWVTYSCDKSASYCFYLPLVTAAWAQVYGAKPLVLLVGSRESWDNSLHGSFVRDECKNAGAVLEYLPSLAGHRDSTVAQVSRMHASLSDCLRNSPETLLATSDVDMLPLARKLLDRAPTRELELFYGNAYLPFARPRFPMCHVRAKVKTWHQILQVGSDTSLESRLVWQLNEGLGRNVDSGVAWHYDEQLLGLRIEEWGGYPGKCDVISRAGDPPAGRLDRAAWGPPREEHFEAHLPRDGHTAPNWKRVRPAFEKALGAPAMRWADTYQEVFNTLL